MNPIIGEKPGQHVEQLATSDLEPGLSAADFVEGQSREDRTLVTCPYCGRTYWALVNPERPMLQPCPYCGTCTCA
jgi:ssDNA-binding Zn-finger/Zn-ribbon topoisomerase 1